MFLVLQEMNTKSREKVLVHQQKATKKVK